MATRKTAKPRLALVGVLTTREKLWAAMRELHTFSVSDLAHAAGVDRHAYRMDDYLGSLVRAGILGKDKPARFAAATYTLLRDLGVDAPRVRKDGSMLPDTAQERMWRAMKVLRTFSVQDLVVHASLPDDAIAPSAAAVYCQWLARGKYLISMTRSGNDVVRYRFVYDSGAKAPQILRVKQLYDCNLGKIVVGDDIQTALDAADASDVRGVAS
ncbi:conserved hypothetical protein [uncultured Desulfovibrio sp.]|uniref:Uncharacterized protein n=1 Tax=uncultured Desulfovibrio sp. TaxID=167968 RepID=A0A212KEC3_9BACT|nr:hypothetical protein [uncultured Desulfovibrio sp.]SBW10066.1 conserved hypothetical protein [uncultured Desulfovibrio sp.]